MWASGDYPHMVDTFLLPIGARLADACPMTRGTRVLDIAAGTGNASLFAAARGAHVTASDLTPELLEAGRPARTRMASSSSGPRRTPSASRLRTRRSMS